jgi:DNA invertase Pin-like site-specific DNA recombinase
MAGRVIGYARCLAGDDERVQRAALAALGAPGEHIHIDVGYSVGAARPALERAITACCVGDILVASSLDRLARSIRDLASIAATLADGGVLISFDGLVFDPATPAGQLMLTLVSRFAKFEGDLARARTIEGMAKARRAGKLPGKQSRLDAPQRRQLLSDYESGEYDIRDLMQMYPLGRSAIYAMINRERDARPAATDP